MGARRRQPGHPCPVPFGLTAGWIAEGVCQTHDMVPMTEEEESDFDKGFDPCIPVIRVWTDKT